MYLGPSASIVSLCNFTPGGRGGGGVEIMRASDQSDSPRLRSYHVCVLQVELAVNNRETAARMVKAKIEKTVLGQVAAHIKAVLQPTAGFVSICLDLDAINRLQLIINPRSVALALLKHSKLKLKADMIR